MKFIQKLFAAGYVAVAGLFFVCACALIWLGAREMWEAIYPGNELDLQARFNMLLECVGVLTIAVAALELGQTVLEEEVQRSANISAPTRVRRFLSRFLIVVVVSLSIECLVGVFRFLHTTPEMLPQAASIGIAAAVLLAAWGAFVRLNVDAERLEPQAMKEAQAEDHAVET
jgi:hypothetical protein